MQYFLDATNLKAQVRRAEIERAHKNGLPAVALLATVLPFEEIQRRNNSRLRVVPEAPLLKMYQAHSQITKEALFAEGFDQVITWDDTTEFLVMPHGTDARHLPGPFAIIGDIHGCYETLMVLLRQLGFDSELNHPDGMIPVVLGDLHDKAGALCAGPYGSGNPEDSGTVKVLRWAIAMSRAGKLLVTDSNHGNKLVRKILRPADVSASNGLQETLDDIAAQPDAIELTNAIVQFLGRTPVSIQLKGGPTGEMVVAHAAMRPDLVGRNDRKAASVCNYLRSFEWHGPQTVIVGHEVTDGPVRQRAAVDPETGIIPGEVIRVDTGCCEGGGLTAYLPHEDRFEHAPTQPVDMPHPKRALANAPRKQPVSVS